MDEYRFGGRPCLQHLQSFEPLRRGRHWHVWSGSPNPTTIETVPDGRLVIGRFGAPPWLGIGGARSAAGLSGTGTSPTGRQPYCPSGLSKRPRRTALPSQILSDRLELAQCRAPARPGGAVEALLDVIVDQRFLGVFDCALDGLELLGELHIGSALLDHCDNRLQMAVGPLEALDHVRMLVGRHRFLPILPGGYSGSPRGDTGLCLTGSCAGFT